jgi:hypothetical protein
MSARTDAMNTTVDGSIECDRHALRAVRAFVVLAASLLFSAPLAAANAQRTFDTPEAAAEALVKAAKARDRVAVRAILGADAAIYSGDAVDDRSAAERFIARYAEKHAIAKEGDARATLNVGADETPFAYPLAKTPAGWRFDTAAGNDEVLARRIGANELAAINVMLAIVDAQQEYASADRDKSGLRTYAAKFASTPGRKDGLYWKAKPGEPLSPLGPLVTQASGEGYGKEKEKGAGPAPYHGYHFRLLKSQGPAASGGAFDYVVKGRMIGGFAAIAWPARYGNSGVMTFIVNHDGVVYERDLGPDTAKLAAAIRRFDPAAGWSAVKR